MNRPAVFGRGHKYHAIRCDRHVPAHASQKECRRFGELELMQRAGLIRNLRQQEVVVLAPAVVIDGRKKPPLRYVADFAYVEREVDANGREVTAHLVLEDAKGMQTPVFRVKRHLVVARGFDLRLS